MRCFYVGCDKTSETYGGEFLSEFQGKRWICKEHRVKWFGKSDTEKEKQAVENLK